MNEETKMLHKLTTEVLDALAAYERFGPDCIFEGLPMIHASVLEELADIARLNAGREVAVPDGWRELAKQSADALQVFTGHDLEPNLRHRYGENWWEPLDDLCKKLRAMLAAAPHAKKEKDDE